MPAILKHIPPRGDLDDADGSTTPDDPPEPQGEVGFAVSTETPATMFDFGMLPRVSHPVFGSEFFFLFRFVCR